MPVMLARRDCRCALEPMSFQFLSKKVMSRDATTSCSVQPRENQRHCPSSPADSCSTDRKKLLRGCDVGGG